MVNFVLNTRDNQAFTGHSDGPMDDDQFRSVIKGLQADAIDYIDGFVSPDRAEATKLYRGDPLGNEEAGRSTIVMTEVRDVILGMLPPLLRVFTQSDRIAQINPRNEKTVAEAEQATDYVNLVFYEDNPGFTVLHSAFKDALTRRLGIIKWRWSKDWTITESALTGVSEQDLAVISEDKFTQIVENEPGEIFDPQMQGADGQPVPPMQLYDVRIRRTHPANRAIVEAVPPEEFIFSRDARDPDNARLMGHRSLQTISDLVAMGYKREVIEEHAGAQNNFPMNYEAEVRNPAVASFMSMGDAGDKSTQSVIYIESWVRVDKDGDGIAELRRVCTLGDAAYVLHDEVADEVPFALFCPDPEPHMIVGQGVTDWTADLQLIKTNIVRNTLDSLAQAVNPKTAVVEGQVNIDDVLNSENGAIIRMRQPGMAQPFAMPFVGAQSLPVLNWFDQVRAMRTGMSPAAQGLDPDILQSTTQDAVTATVNGAQERVELIARIFAETGLKRLFRGLYKLVCENMDRPRMVRLRGQFVQVDPRTWDKDCDVSVDVALGRGTDQDKMRFLMLVAQKQEQLLQTLGPSNPVCTLAQYSNTLMQICTMAGFKDGARYFNQVTPQQAQQMAQQPPRPDPNMALVEIEKQKLQIDAQSKQAKAQLDHMKLQLDQAEQTQRLQMDMAIAQLKAHGETERTRLNAMVQMAVAEIQAGTGANSAHNEAMISADIAHADREADLHKHVHSTVTQAMVDAHGNHLDAQSEAHQAQLDHAAQLYQADQAAKATPVG